MLMETRRVPPLWEKKPPQLLQPIAHFLQPSWLETLLPSDCHAWSSVRTSSWALNLNCNWNWFLSYFPSLEQSTPFLDSQDKQRSSQHLTNSLKVTWRNSSSLECLFVFLNMASLYLNHRRWEQISRHPVAGTDLSGTIWIFIEFSLNEYSLNENSMKIQIETDTNIQWIFIQHESWWSCSLPLTNHLPTIPLTLQYRRWWSQLTQFKLCWSQLTPQKSS